MENTNDTFRELEKMAGVTITEEMKQRILNDCRNPIKDWSLLNSNNPVKLLFFIRVLTDLVLEKSNDQTALAAAKLFSKLDRSINLMHAWEYARSQEKTVNEVNVTVTIKQATTLAEPVQAEPKLLNSGKSKELIKQQD